MNTRKITKYMLLVLLFLLILICLSLLFKDEQNVDDEIDIVNGSYESNDEIELNNFSNLYGYFSSFDEGVKAKEAITNELIKYNTPVRNFDTTNVKEENGMLTFDLVSLDESIEEYTVCITENETVIGRTK